MLDFDLKAAKKKRMLKLMSSEAYESSKLYAERTKWWHDKYTIKKQFKEGNRVLLFNSEFRLLDG